MKTLNELIEEKLKALDDLLDNRNDDGDLDTSDQEFIDLFKTALKEIALQSIEAVSLEEEKFTENDASKHWCRGFNAARQEAKQRAGVFLGETSPS